MSNIHRAKNVTRGGSDRPLKKQMMHIMRILPMMGATALFLKHQVAQGEGIALTNGKSVQVMDAFFDLQYEEQLAILVHEYLHVTMAHPYRGMLLHRRLGEAYQHQIANIAADMICNGAIDCLPARNLRLPKGLISWSETTANLKEACDAFNIPYHDNDLKLSGARFERLYELLVMAQEASCQCLACPEDGGENGGENRGSSGHQGSNDNEQEEGQKTYTHKQRKIAEKIMNLTGMAEGVLKDLLDDLAEQMSDEDLRSEIRKAAERLKNEAAQYGNMTSSLLEILKGDIPRVETPWEKRFNNVAASMLSYERVKNRQRPGNSMLSQHAMGRKMKIWKPARKSPMRPRIIVIADSSGSVSDKAFLATLAQVSAMRRRTNASLHLIVADTQVQSITEIKRDSDIPKVEFTGRGGTDFIVPLAEAEKLKADLVVYVTDLCGSFPEKCKIPVIWAVVPEHAASLKAPFGEIIEVDKWK